MYESSIDQLDRRILHALQVEPRAPWAALASVIGVDAATISRRWQRMHEAGIAWVTGHGPWPTATGGMALVEIVCEPAMVSSVVAKLQAEPRVMNIDRTTGGRDLLVALLAPELDELWRYYADDLSRIPGIRSLLVHVLSDLASEGSGWRLRDLSPTEVAAVPSAPAPRPRAARSIPDELRAILEYELLLDGRATTTAIAKRWGLHSQRVAVAIALLRARGQLAFRTDIARGVSAWPVYAWYFVEAAADTLPQLRVTLARVPEIRVVAISASKYNLLLALWVRDLRSIVDFEAAFERVASDARVADRSVVVHNLKNMGRALDEQGRVAGPVIPFRPRPRPLP